MNLKTIFACSLILILSSCLRTRADLGEQEQSQFYGRKNADNQLSASSGKSSQLGTKAQAAIDDRDDLIRSFNGRIESLENQINTLQKEKAATTANNPETQKIQLLQDALVKMEAQIQKLEAEVAAVKPAAAAAVVGSDLNTVKSSANGKKAVVAATAVANTYDVAQDHFGRKEWKKAILSYQKYVDENAKDKNVPDAKYKIGVCFQELGMKDEAMAFYEEVIANFGKTESGKKAKIRLTKIKK